MSKMHISPHCFKITPPEKNTWNFRSSTPSMLGPMLKRMRGAILQLTYHVSHLAPPCRNARARSWPSTKNADKKAALSPHCFIKTSVQGLGENINWYGINKSLSSFAVNNTRSSCRTRVVNWDTFRSKLHLIDGWQLAFCLWRRYQIGTRSEFEILLHFVDEIGEA